ncbi:putative ankyrin repeat protein [Chlorella vulgaris]
MQKRKKPATRLTWAKQRKSLDNDEANAKHLRRSAVDEEAADAGGDGVSWSSAQQAALDDQLLQQQHVPAADAPSDGRYCDLMWKAVAFHDDAQLQRLVASGADINDEMPGLGLTPLQYCAAQGSNIKAVIAAGALLDDQNDKGLTALMLATRDNKVHAARALLEAGASVALADNKGWTVLHWAASTAWYGLNVKELIEAGADIAATSHTGDTPLHEAVRRKAWHTAAMLVAAGASVDQANDSQQSPLDLAAGCPQMVKLLQAKSAGTSLHESSDRVIVEGGGKGSAAEGKQEHQSQPTAQPPSLPSSGRGSPSSLCIASPTAARTTPALQHPAASLQQQLQQVRPLLEQCRAAGQLDLEAAADYRTTFTHWLSAEQRSEDLMLFAELAAAGKQAKLGECIRRVAAMQQQRQSMASTRQGGQTE